MSQGSELDKLLAARWLPSTWAQRICKPADLPVCLEQYVQALPADLVWRAYTDGVRLWFAVARAAKPMTKDLGGTALDVYFFTGDGQLSSGGRWKHDTETGWRLCAGLGNSPPEGRRPSHLRAISLRRT